MCLIAYTEDKDKIDLATMENAYDNNPHGWGIVYAEGGRLFSCKRMSNFKMFTRTLKEVPAKVPLAIHFRWATHGTKSLSNVHPFEIFSVNSGDSLDLCMAHNGIIHGTDKYKINANDPRSDTSLYIDNIIKPLLKNNVDLLFNPGIVSLLEKDIGYNNKFIFLFGDGRHVILNRNAGYESKEHPDVWFSNSYSINSNTHRVTKSNNFVTPTAYNGSWDYRRGIWLDDAPVTPPPPSVSSKSTFSDTYVIEENIPKELQELIDTRGQGSVLLNPTQNSQIFGPGWVKTGNIITNGNVEIVKAHNEFIRERAKRYISPMKKENEYPLLQGLESKLDSSDFRVMNESEIMEWIVSYPKETSSWLLKNMNFSGNVTSIEAWLQSNLDNAVDIIFQKTHFNIHITPKVLNVKEVEEDDYNLEYMM